MMSSRRYFSLGLCLTLLCTIYAQQATSRIDRNITIYNDVMRQLDINYVDTLNYEQLTETAINEMLRKVDPYTVYFPKKKDDNLKMMTTGKYGGIGAIIQQRDSVDKDGEKHTYMIIANPYEGKPAQRHDVLAGDQILSVDGWSTKDQSVQSVSEHLRGVPGTTVTLQLLRDGVAQPFTREFQREEVHMDPIEYTGIYCDSVAYIALGEFTEGAAHAFTMALDQLVNQQGAKALVFDLRGNGGGIVDEAIGILSNFLDKGTEVVSTKGKLPQTCRTYATTSYPVFRDLPLVVLVDKSSASASEIVAGSLQDLQRATLIGQRTFGKGLVQNLRPIAYDGHLKVTTSKYYLPSGRCIQAIDYAERQRGNKLKRDTAGGILPDIVMTDSQKVDICYSLYVKHMFFDYSVRYRRMHDSIAPAALFELTDEDIRHFCSFLEEKHFTYETETSKYFHDVLEMAANEDLDSTVIAALKAFEPQLRPSYQEAIERHMDEVKQMLGAEIIERYYFQKGRAQFLLREDKELRRALEFLTHTTIQP